jgi:hypothetical protein
MKGKCILAAILMAAAGTASAAGASADGKGASATAGPASGSETAKSAREHNSSAMFTGRNAVVRVAGDTVEAHNGELKVNGVPHGTVDDNSVVKYVASGKKKTLTVNGVPRVPHP